MKTRDELAEAFVLELLARPRNEQLASGIVADAFAYADLFVAEREKRAGPARMEALKFSHDGDLLNDRGQQEASWRIDGYGGRRMEVEEGRWFVSVALEAQDRAHAERILAAMLPVGRGTK